MDDLVLVHLGVIVTLKVLIIILVIVVCGGVLLSGLGEVDDLSTGAATDDVAAVNLLHVVLVLFLFACTRNC